MVQFVFTPWRNRAELLEVRAQLYPHAIFNTATTTTTTTATTRGTRPAPTRATTTNTTIVTTAAAASAPPPPPPPPSGPWWASEEELCAVEKAIARVFMWVHRGGCPHVVESTALLMAAMVSDARGSRDAVAGAGVTAGYLVGFTRFVTGLLDSHQDKARKLSMYGVAKTLGLPASFVELRHQGTHEPMPSLGQLRPAARRALVWIWEYYWKNLHEGEKQQQGADLEKRRNVKAGNGDGRDVERATMTTTTTTTTTTATLTTTLLSGDGEKGFQHSRVTTRSKAATVRSTDSIQERMCRAALLGFLQRQEDDVGVDTAREGLMRQLSNWDEALVLNVLADIGVSSRDAGILLRSVKLCRAIRNLPVGEAMLAESTSEEELRTELRRAREGLEQQNQTLQPQGKAGGQVTGKRKKGSSGGDDGDENDEAARGGWRRWQGPWTPKPIGVL